MWELSPFGSPLVCLQASGDDQSGYILWKIHPFLQSEKRKHLHLSLIMVITIYFLVFQNSGVFKKPTGI